MAHCAEKTGLSASTPPSKNVATLYGGGEEKYGLKPVLNDINLNVFGKQITVVFSPPDSGKTTMMKLITGCLAPDNGAITVGSCDVANNAEGARRVLAYCPYNGTLFDDLTVEEHLTFFGTAKGGFGDQVRRDVSRLMRDTGLSRYRGWYVDQLSPAQQRLLSAATAMMPYAEVEMIVMDEPTRNMDPSSRRELWEVLLKLRRERGVFLTTSDYAEAEALADRIVVLNRGTIFCAGSPEYIKSQFGMGYLLRLEKGRGYRAAAVDALIYKQAPAAGKAEENASSVVYRLTGFSDLLASLMRDILYDLEKSKRTLGVARIGIKVTTMEDVLQGISDRRSTPSSRDQSVFSRKGEAPSSKEPSVVAAKADVGWLLPVSAGGMAALKMLRGRSRDDPSSVSTVRALMHKRLLDWTRSVALRSPYWLLPSALLLLGGYCENALLASVPTLRTTLTYDVQEIVGPAIGFCGATQNGSLRALVMQRVCPLLEGSGVRLRSIDLTQVESQLLSLAADDVRDYVFRYTMGVVTTDRERRFALWFNGQNPHSALLALNLLHIALLRDITGDPESFVRLTNTPDNFQAVESEDTLLNFFREFELSRVRRESAGYVVHAVLVRVLCAVFLPAALCYHAAHFVLPVLVERMSAAKHLQLMAGLSGAVYWLGHLLFDVLLCVAHALLFTAAAVAFRSFLGWPYIRVFGALLTTAADMLAFSASPPTLQVLIEIVMTVPIRWLPTYIVTRGFTKLILLHKESLICAEGGLLLKRYCEKNFLRFTTSLAQCCPQYGEPHPKREHRSVDEPLSASFHSGFFELSALFLEACFCFAAAAFLDSDLLQRLWSHLETGRESYEYAQPTVDADVRKERKLVDDICNQRAFAQHALVVHCLSKAYGFLQPRLAVDDVSFALRRGECLGLVGVLGTGKSTLLGVLGGELFPSSGDAYMSSLSLTRHYRQWMQSVGYVPYDWGLVDGLTGREMICVLATLRGVQDVPRTTACALRVVELAEPDAPIASYGAGAKTQLSLALALMSLPRVYLLDLPELDAPSRIVVRRVLELLRPTSSVVLTCEHLHHFEGVCDRIAILVAGRIECLGSLKDLSDKYCRGTTIVIYTYPDRKYDVDHQRFIAIEMIEHFPTCTLERCYEGQLEFRIAETQASLGEMFDRLLYIKRRRKFHLFYVSDTTMDQIFASLGRKHAGLQCTRVVSHVHLGATRVVAHVRRGEHDTSARHRATAGSTVERGVIPSSSARQQTTKSGPLNSGAILEQAVAMEAASLHD
ncbi:retinal-specific phospholipid-transporting ATPase ABCA4-like [Dermacentor silvarum]|uniref:retinal-specific phospholipid-transporting ATPase ABCA4-like n=1 Tax=Dermacentor silvarum TaxID=543639 RepID=UPI0021018140|nr:retinal-specific phospholipid-transporting ATPase ABCA4-like [Dermacentor silvarum]